MTESLNESRQHILDTAHQIIAVKGFSAVGLAEILQASGVPKGSFYYYFGTKDSFGKALLERYFSIYICKQKQLLNQADLTVPDRLLNYFEHWLRTETSNNPAEKCLTVKLATEVSDLSEAMRNVLDTGTEKVVMALEGSISCGLQEGLLSPNLEARPTATALYHMWLGASVRYKITRDTASLDDALTATRMLLGLAPGTK